MSKDIEESAREFSIQSHRYDEAFIELIQTQPRKDHENPSVEHQRAIREYWAETASLLRKLVGYHMRHQKVPHPFPHSPLERLANLCEELGSGVIPELVELARSAGRPLKFGERRDIARALFFLEAVSLGMLDNSAPIKTVADCFNVTKQTVRNWRERAEEICRDIDRPHPELIEQSMRTSGKRYTVIGRGAPSN